MKRNFTSTYQLLPWMLFILVFSISMAFAVYTNHAWEDWFITFRASRNLAMGNGLVFTVGERVHSFTSPLGTLIPALLSLVTANSSEALVLWMFRIINCSLLGLAAVLLLRISRQFGMTLFPSLMVIGLFAVDAKVIDFSINGQETALMMIFLAATIHVMSVPLEAPALMLGLAWGGLMWTRPDSFVYVGGLALGYLLFNPVTPSTRNRGEMLRLFARAGCVTTAVYLPWTLGTWYYYGSPIPHTVIAKGLLSTAFDGLPTKILSFPYQTLFGINSVVTTFLPPYYYYGGWPGVLVDLYGGLALLCIYYWCLPFALPFGRALSFACFVGHGYLTLFAPVFYPWYLPSITLLSVLVLGQMAHQGMTLLCRPGRSWGKYLRYPFLAGGGAVLVGSLFLTLATAHQLRLQQEIIENGNRKQIGLWLRENAASPHETVFLECLGYIGFYSQLKMLDYPGLSSPEVVSVRRRLQTNDFGPLIEALQPDWLVLRPFEIKGVEEVVPGLLDSRYRREKIFDVSGAIGSHPLIFGRQYLQYDQTFVVFRKLAGTPVAR